MHNTSRRFSSQGVQTLSDFRPLLPREAWWTDKFSDAPAFDTITGIDNMAVVNGTIYRVSSYLVRFLANSLAHFARTKNTLMTFFRASNPQGFKPVSRQSNERIDKLSFHTDTKDNIMDTLLFCTNVFRNWRSIFGATIPTPSVQAFNYKLQGAFNFVSYQDLCLAKLERVLLKDTDVALIRDRGAYQRVDAEDEWMLLDLFREIDAYSQPDTTSFKKSLMAFGLQEPVVEATETKPVFMEYLDTNPIESHIMTDDFTYFVMNSPNAASAGSEKRGSDFIPDDSDKKRARSLSPSRTAMTS